MPFLMANSMLVCIGHTIVDPLTTYVAWKIHLADSDNELRRIETGLPQDSIECSPSCYITNNVYIMTFYGGVWAQDRSHIRYSQYRMTGLSLDSLSKARKVNDDPLRTGFDGPLYAARGVKEEAVIDRKSDGKVLIFNGRFETLNRLTFRADAPHQILATGLTTNMTFKTYLIDLELGVFREVMVDGKSVYKSSICGNRIAYTVGDGDEDRRIEFGVPQIAITRDPITLE